MATTASIASVLSVQAQTGAATSSSQHARARRQSAGNAATLFTSSALDVRAAQLNALADQASHARKADPAAQIRSLIGEGRDIVRRALEFTSTAAKVTGLVADMTPIADLDMDQGDSITVSDGRATATYIHSAGNDLQDLIDTVNDTPGLQVKASLTDDKRLRLDAAGLNGITVGGTANTEQLARIGLEAGTTVGQAHADRLNLARAFDAIRERIDAVRLDAGSASGSPATADSLGIRRATAGESFQSNSEVESFLADLDRAEKALENKSRADATSSQTEFTRSAIQVLGGGSDDVTIERLDETGAEAVARQVHAQLAATAQSLAGTGAAEMLRLFP